MTLHLLYNPKSGSGRGAEVAEIAARLCKEQGAELVLHAVTDPHSIGQKAREAIEGARRDGGVAAAAGGDGTIRAIAHEARNTEVRVAAIPCGTFNLFAREHQIPEDPEEALRLALTGTAKPVRLAEVNGETFILNASFGLYAKAIRERKARTKRFGRRRIVAVLSTFKSLLEGNRPIDVELTIDGKKERHRTHTIFIGNNQLQLSELKLKAASCFDTDRLAVFTLKETSRLGIAKLLLHGFTKTLESADAIESTCAECLVVEPRKRTVELALDGEMFRFEAPLVIKSHPGSLLLVTPL